MDISHVIRGDDHISNTPKQILIYRALGAPIPHFLHMPLLFGTDKKKLSKRHGATKLEQLTAMGFIAEVVRNYLCFLSSEFDESMVSWTLADLVEHFDVEQLGTSASIFDPDKLRWMNGRFIRELDAAALGARLVEYLERTGFYGDPAGWAAPDAASAPRAPVAATPEQAELTRQIAPLVQAKIELLADVAGIAGWFFRPLRLDGPALERLRVTDGAKEALQAAAAGLRGLAQWDVHSVESLVRALPVDLDLKPKAVFAALRLGMSGQSVTPGLFESLWLLGRDEAADRLTAAAARL
jgi:glutamyl-tRNA synthetase